MNVVDVVYGVQRWAPVVFVAGFVLVLVGRFGPGVVERLRAASRLVDEVRADAPVDDMLPNAVEQELLFEVFAEAAVQQAWVGFVDADALAVARTVGVVAE